MEASFLPFVPYPTTAVHCIVKLLRTQLGTELSSYNKTQFLTRFSLMFQCIYYIQKSRAKLTHSSEIGSVVISIISGSPKDITVGPRLKSISVPFAPVTDLIFRLLVSKI